MKDVREHSKYSISGKMEKNLSKTLERNVIYILIHLIFSIWHDFFPPIRALKMYVHVNISFVEDSENCFIF